MDAIQKELALQKIQDVMNKHDYIFDNREDFTEARTSWNDLATIADDFYHTLLHIQHLIK